MRRAVVFVALALLAAWPVFAQTPCNPEKADCTIDEALNFYRGAALVESTVVNTNKPTTTPDAFAGRVHNSYQDFLNLFSFAVNEVDESENGQSLVIRFNPIREGNHLLGLTATVTKPVIADAVKNAIPVGARDATVALLEKQQGDLDDQTWSASYSYASDDCPPESGGGRCWGRQPKAYRNLLSLLLPEPEANQTASNVHGVADLAADLSETFGDVEGDVGTMKVSQSGQPERAMQLIKQIVALEKGSNESAVELYKSLHLDILPALIDNQPQITGSATYRVRGRLGGADELGATLELHWGRQNVNTLRSACKTVSSVRLGGCLQRALAALAVNGPSTDKFVVTATYKDTGAYTLDTLGLPNPVDGFTAVKLPSSSQVNVKVQGGRQLGAEVAGKPARADLSFEGIRTEDDGVRTKNRWVGTLTLSVPIGNNMTIPVSVTYANKAEFLGDQDERLGAHFGLSYRLPELFKKTP